jgi:hypothetical protein
MTLQLLLAPAGHGKTAYAVAEARRHARDLSATPTVLLVSALRAQSFRRRLARAGGVSGVRRGLHRHAGEAVSPGSRQESSSRGCVGKAPPARGLRALFFIGATVSSISEIRGSPFQAPTRDPTVVGARQTCESPRGRED